MSYSISLIDPVTYETLEVDEPHFVRGCNYAIGGTTSLWITVTYNYGAIFRTVLGPEGIRTIYGMTGAESIPVLKAAISKLKDDADENYWNATEGNAKQALYGLLAFAQMRPDGVWQGD